VTAHRDRITASYREGKIVKRNTVGLGDSAKANERLDPDGKPVQQSALYKFAQRIEVEERLDPIVEQFRAVLPSTITEGPGRALLGGQWLGHAFHPLLTDFPLGAWSSASLLDLIGGRRCARAATTLVGFGVLAAIPTAIAGASDWSVIDPRSRRVGLVHAATNTAALSCYAISLVARLRGKRARGVAWGLAGGCTAIVGGFFGGHLTLARPAGVEATTNAMHHGASSAGEPRPVGV
jgi:uncharacterized membrane protein